MLVSALIFDRDGVLTTSDQRAFARDVLSRIPLDASTLAARWRAWNEEHAIRDERREEERIRSFLGAIANELGLSGQAREALIELDYSGYVTAFDDARPALVQARRQGLRIGLLTNNSMGVSPTRLVSLAGLADFVDFALTSQMIGKEKPAVGAYHSVAEALGVPVHKCLYFNDREACVNGARWAGMQAWLVDRTRASDDVAGGILKSLAPMTEVIEIARATAPERPRANRSMGIPSYPLVATLRAVPAAHELVEALWRPLRALPPSARTFPSASDALPASAVDAHRKLVDLVRKHGIAATATKVISDAERMTEATPHPVRERFRSYAFSIVDRLREFDGRAGIDCHVNCASV